MNKKLLKQLQSIKKASYSLALISHADRNKILSCIAKNLKKSIPSILKENKKDLARMDKNNPKYDRLMLTSDRLLGIISDIKTVISLPDPTGKILMKHTLKNGIKLKKITVPIGVIGIIYESRPNVTVDTSILCIKSGNCVMLRGGSDAYFSNKIFVQILKNSLYSCGITKNCIHLINKERSLIKEMLTANEYIDVIIPRGSASLINFVRDNASVPVIETGAGIVHIYVDKKCKTEAAVKIIYNAKTHRPSVCNALDTLVIHKSSSKKVLSALANLLKPAGVIIYADKKSFNILKINYPKSLLKKAQEKHFGTEFLSLKMSIKTVSSLNEAIAHIRKNSSRHTEVIISKNKKNIEKFLREIDAAAVFANCSTRFTDGREFGLGAEIGISTQTLHARGPMSLEEIVSYKWIGIGNGQIRK